MSLNSDQPDVVPELPNEVGYGKPPEVTRFKKGVSGNPKGRPRGSLNVATVFIKTLREKVVIIENGRRKTVTKLEAALKQLVNKAASGDIRALRQLLESARDAEAKQNAPGAQDPAIGELDQEVIDGILKRFEIGEEEKDQELREANHGDDQRG
jgi:Family of unknown function (DUF5681)